MSKHSKGQDWPVELSEEQWRQRLTPAQYRVLREEGGNVHRKGATPAYAGQPLLIPGSMGHDSYLLTGLGNERWLRSASHGAGRSMSRSEIVFKAKKDKAFLGLQGVECITTKEERMIEEAPGAYKEIGQVIQSQVEEGTVSVMARLRSCSPVRFLRLSGT